MSWVEARWADELFFSACFLSGSCGCSIAFKQRLVVAGKVAGIVKTREKVQDDDKIIV